MAPKPADVVFAVCEQDIWDDMSDNKKSIYQELLIRRFHNIHVWYIYIFLLKGKNYLAHQEGPDQGVKLYNVTVKKTSTNTRCSTMEEI